MIPRVSPYGLRQLARIALASLALLAVDAQAQDAQPATEPTASPSPNVRVIQEDFRLEPGEQQRIRRNEPMVQPLPNARATTAPRQPARPAPTIQLPEQRPAPEPSSAPPRSGQAARPVQPVTPRVATPAPASGPEPATVEALPAPQLPTQSSAVPAAPATALPQSAPARPLPISDEEAENWASWIWILPALLALGLAIFGAMFFMRRRAEAPPVYEKIEPYHPPVDATPSKPEPVARAAPAPQPARAANPGGLVQVPARRPAAPPPPVQRPAPQADGGSRAQVSPEGFVTIRPARAR